MYFFKRLKIQAIMFSVALKFILYDKTRSLMTLAGVIFSVSLIFAQMGVYFGLMETSSIIIDNTPGDIWVTSKNSKNFDFSQPLPEYIHEHTISTEGIEWAEKLIVTWGVIKQKTGGTEQVEIVGFNPETGVGAPWRMKVGNFKSVKNGNFMIVDDSSKKRLGEISVGDYRDVLSRRLKVVGISEGIRSFTTAPYIFTSYVTAQQIAAIVGQDKTVFVIAKVAPGFTSTEVKANLSKRLKGVDVYTSDEFSRKTRLYWTIETGVGFSFLLTIVISFLVGILIVGQTIYNSTMEHIKEFGTLKALGAENYEIYKIIFSQSMITALLGYIISLIIILFSAKLFESLGTTMVVQVWTNLLVLVLTLIMCLLSAAVSIRRIKSIDPAILFRG
jgi:putative ABC transport system permease protein